MIMPIERIHRSRWMIAGLLILCILANLSILNNDFTNWDDPAQVLENADVQQLSLSNTLTIFSSFYVGMYQPLTMFIYTAIYSMAGANPGVFHFFSLLFHLLNIMLGFILVRNFSRKEAPALIVAAMFALNPLQSESVAWVSAMSNLLYTAFFLAGSITYLSYIRDKRTKYFYYTLALFILSLLSKPSAVTFPVVILFMDIYFRRRFGTRVLLEKLPFFILSVAMGLMIILARQDAGHIIAISDRYSLWERPFLIAYALAFYISKLFAPLGLSAFHPYPDTPLPFDYFIAPLIPLAFIFLYTRLRAESRRQYMVGMMFFLINILLVLEIIPLGVQVVKERYVYLPSIGMYYAFASLLIFFFPLRKPTAKWPIIIVSLFLLWFGLSTYSRTLTWKDSISLWNDVIQTYPEASAAYINRGNAYLAIEDYQLAVDDYSQALFHEPNAADAYLNRAIGHYHLDKKTASLLDYDRAIAMGIDDAEAYNSRGLLRASIGDDEGALEDFVQASKIEPAFVDAWVNLGLIYASNSSYARAFESFSSALKADAESARAYYWRGMLQINMQQYEGACNDLKNAKTYGWPIGQLPEICN